MLPPLLSLLLLAPFWLVFISPRMKPETFLQPRSSPGRCSTKAVTTEPSHTYLSDKPLSVSCCPSSFAHRMDSLEETGTWGISREYINWQPYTVMFMKTTICVCFPPFLPLVMEESGILSISWKYTCIPRYFNISEGVFVCFSLET